jgi:hypothetical protein
MKITVSIDRDGVWAGDGVWTEDCCIIDCPAVLGPTQDDSDETYDSLCEALAGLPQDDDHWCGPVSVQREDGIYTATLIAK